MLLDRVSDRWSAAVIDHPDGWCGCLKHWLIVVLVLGVCGLSVLVYASPPDSSELPGIYDSGDYDDVVALLADTLGLAISPLLGVKPGSPVGFAASHLSPVPPEAPPLGFHPRSPPST
jgi:hypothetical protein